MPYFQKGKVVILKSGTENNFGGNYSCRILHVWMDSEVYYTNGERAYVIQFTHGPVITVILGVQ